jgi:hypothetical protein
MMLQARERNLVQEGVRRLSIQLELYEAPSAERSDVGPVAPVEVSVGRNAASACAEEGLSNGHTNPPGSRSVRGEV